MNWEAFLGALLPSLLTLLAAIATYYKSKASASSADDASYAANSRVQIALRIEQKVDAMIAAQKDGGVKTTPPSLPSPAIQPIEARSKP